MKRAAFIDRDGVINPDRGYVAHWEEFDFLPGVSKALRLLQRSGFELIVVTNQSGLARGLYTLSDYESLTDRYTSYLAGRGVFIRAVYFCPHHPEGQIERWAIDCQCRKPAPGMLLQASQDHDLDLSASFMVGDKFSDIEAAFAGGIKRAFWVSNDPECPGHDMPRVEVVDSLLECAKSVASNSGLMWNAS